MTDTQNALFQMFSAVTQVYNSNLVALSTYTQFDNAYQKFAGLYNGIPDLIEQQGMSTTGATLDKDEAEAVLIKTADKLLIGIRALAANTHDNSLKKTSLINHSKMTRTSDAALIGLAKEIHDTADTHLAALAPFGIIAADVTAVDAAINAFSALLGKPREALEPSKLATAKLRDTFDTCRGLLSNEMDTAIEAYGLSHPDIAAAWRNARKIIETGGRHLSMIIQVTDGSTGQPLPGVDIVIMPDNEKKKTGEKGGCDVAHLSEGNKTITVSKAEYAAVTVNAGVTSGETDKLHIIMHPIA